MKKPTISAVESAAFEQWISKLALEQLVEDIEDQQMEHKDAGNLEQRLERLLNGANEPETSLAVELIEDQGTSPESDSAASFSAMIQRLALEQMVEDIELASADEPSAEDLDRRADLRAQFIADAVGIKGKG